MIDAVLLYLERPWVSLIIGTAIGLLGILISVILYRKSTNTNELSFIKVEVSILGVNNPSWQESLEIKYEGVQIIRLTAGRTGFWNSGNTTISGDQILQNDPLRIFVPEGERLLVCHASAVSRHVLGICTDKIDDATYGIKFDYLDPGDGFVIHTAQSSQIETINIAGTIKGIPNGPRRLAANNRLWSILVDGTLLPTLIFMGLGFFASFGSDRIIKLYNLPMGSTGDRLVTAGFIVVGIAGAVAAAFMPDIIRRRGAARIPKVISKDPVLATFLGLKLKKDESI